MRKNRNNLLGAIMEGVNKLLYGMDRRVLFGIGAAVLVIIVAAVIILVIPKTVTAEEGTLSFNVTADGVVVRDELLYQMDVNGKAEFAVEEGEAVAQGQEIAVVYSRDYSESAITDLKNCQTKVYDYIKNNLLKDVLNKDLSDMDAQISVLSEQIKEEVKSADTGNLLSLERQLQSLMKDRQDFLREQVNIDSQLQKLMDEESALSARIEGWKKSSAAERDGIVSFYFDGAEAVLTPANMKKLTASDISSILNGKSYYTLTNSTSTRPLYRLIDANNWYVILMCDEEIPEFAENTTFKAVFRSDDNVYTAKMSGMKQDDKKFLYYFEFSQNIGNLLIARNVKMTVSADYTGIMVPEKAVKTQDGVDGIYARIDNKRTFIPVTVLIKNEGYVIIQATENAELLVDKCEVYV